MTQRSWKRTAVAGAALLAATAVVQAQGGFATGTANQSRRRARNVIFFVGHPIRVSPAS